MVFDFTDYVYSALISIFSMIMGMAYPLINSSISEIDNKYGSTMIVNSFLHEGCYRRFQVSLAWSIVAAVVSPFILLCVNGASKVIILWLLIHTLIVLSLIVCSISLYKTLMEYKLPNTISDRLSKRIEQEDNIVMVAELARYAAHSNMAELYLNNTHFVWQELKRQMNHNRPHMERSAMFNTAGRESRLSENAKKAISIYSSISCDIDIKWSIYRNDISTISAIFASKMPLLEGDLLLLWRLVSEAARSGNEDWIKSYWTQATQYLSFFDQNRGYWNLKKEDREKCDKEKREFKKMHIAMIGMLIEYDRESYIESLLYHSRTLPFTYPLCDNTFKNLYEDWKDFYCDENTYHLMNQLNVYPIYGLDGNINDEWRLIRIIEKSLALQLIRLYGMDYNVEYTDPFELLDDSGTVEDKQYKLRMLSRMRDAVNRIFEDGLEVSLSGHKYFSQFDALTFIQRNVEKINGAVNQLINNPAVDENKRQTFITLLKTKWEAANIHFGEAQSLVAYCASESPCELSIDIPDSYILSGYGNVDYVPFVDSIIGGIKSLVYRSYAYALDYNHPKHLFKVQYTDVGKALERLEVNSEYLILCNDFYIDRFFAIYKNDKYREDGVNRYFNDAKMMEICAPATTPFIIIIKKQLLPYVEIGRDEYANMPALSNQPYLYSNIHNINANNYKHAIIRLRTYTYTPTDFNFVKLIMPYEIGIMDLNKIRSLSYLGYV